MTLNRPHLGQSNCSLALSRVNQIVPAVTVSKDKRITQLANAEGTFTTLWLVALDGQPIAASQRMLLQIMTEERPKGWVEEPAEFTDRKGEKHSGMRIVEQGGKGWEIRAIEGSISLKRSDAAQFIAQPVDANFYPQGAPVKGLYTLQLKPDVLHYIIQTDE